MEPLSLGSLGEKGTWVCKGMCGGEGKEGSGPLMTEAVPIPLESPPILGQTLSVSLETGFGLLRIHEGRDKITN